MDFLLTAYLIMTATFFSYVAFIWKRFGILPSISDSYYHLSKNEKPLFTFFCWGFSLPAAIIGFTLSETSIFQFLMFFVAAGIMFVGASPDFKNGMDKTVHSISAYVGVITGHLFIFFTFKELWFILPSFIIFSLLFLFNKNGKNAIWWIEIFTFLSISYAFLVNL